METVIKPLNNENGSAIVLALIILAVLTVIGISASTTSTVELKIVRNEKIHNQNFYYAEAGVYEGAQRIEQEADPEVQLIAATTGYDWLNDNTIDFSTPANWQDSGPASGDVNDNSDPSVVDPTVSLAANAKGVRPGGSLDMGSTRLYEYSVFGLSQWNGGRSIIEIGYLRRF
jgi:Tfp pilus assembly protein PilX